ncbi:hypothetical protein UT5_11310 [Ferrigenium sp. UT5]
MDEAIFRQRLQTLQQRHCPFQKAILSACVACARSDRVQIAEREVVVCDAEPSHRRCEELHAHLRHNFGFAVGVLHDELPLPHAQEMRIQCGGLRGLAAVVAADPEVRDVDALLEQVLQRFQRLADIDFSIVVHISREIYQGRQRPDGK